MVSFLAVGTVWAGGPDARAYSRVIAAMIWPVQGRVATSAAAGGGRRATSRPATAEIRSRSRLGSRPRAGPVEGEHLRPGPAARRPARRARTRSGSGRSRAAAGYAARCPWLSGSRRQPWAGTRQRCGPRPSSAAGPGSSSSRSPSCGLAGALAEDHRLPWERRRRPGRLPRGSFPPRGRDRHWWWPNSSNRPVNPRSAGFTGGALPHCGGVQAMTRFG